MTEDLERGDAEAVLEARRELGPSYDAALAESFADRIERAIDARVESRTQLEAGQTKLLAESARRQWVLGIISCGVGIPVTAMTGTGSEGSVAKLLVSWAGLVGVNLAHALAGRLRR